jgi:hypothetical protein
MNSQFYRCPKCEHRSTDAMPSDGQCPACGIYFHKWEAAQKALADDAPVRLSAAQSLTDGALTYWQRYGATLLMPQSNMRPEAFYGRCAALLFMVVMGWCMAALDYHVWAFGGMATSAMSYSVVPFHEVGHVLMLPFGEFLEAFGGTLFQEATPLALGVAFIVINRDNFAAAVCLWWSGVGLTRTAAYVYSALDEQMVPNEAGGHDWVAILEYLGQLHRAHQWGFVVHKLAVLAMIIGVVWGAIVLRRQRDALDVV